jgi:hypothetical protein
MVPHFRPVDHRNAMAINDDLNPAHIVSVRDFLPSTLEAVIALLEVSTDFEHLVYRESELDALWSISGFLLTELPDLQARGAAGRLHDSAHAAHDLVAAGQPREAARILRSCLK